MDKKGGKVPGGTSAGKKKPRVVGGRKGARADAGSKVKIDGEGVGIPARRTR